MAAISVKVDLTPASWLEHKPDDYASKALETALKKVSTAKDNLPKSVTDTLSGLKAAIKLMEEFVAAAEATASAGSATRSELLKEKAKIEKASDKEKDKEARHALDKKAFAYGGAAEYIVVLGDRLSKAVASVK